MDRQLGKLFDHLRESPTLRDNTVILVCSDNGPEPGAGSAGTSPAHSPLMLRARRGGQMLNPTLSRGDLDELVERAPLVMTAGAGDRVIACFQGGGAGRALAGRAVSAPPRGRRCRCWHPMVDRRGAVGRSRVARRTCSGDSGASGAGNLARHRAEIRRERSVRGSISLDRFRSALGFQVRGRLGARVLRRARELW